MTCFRNMIKLRNFKWPKVPVVKKCCFCIPTRTGIAIFGYVNLVLSLIAFPWLVYLFLMELVGDKPVQPVHNIDPIVHLPVIMTIALVDISMTVLLLVGVHKNNKRLFKIYFYFGIVFELVTVLTDIPFFDSTEYKENALYVIFLLLNIYQLFLVHNVVYATEEDSEVQYIAYEDHRGSV